MSRANPARPRDAWLPFEGESRVRRLVKVAGWIAAVALAVGATPIAWRLGGEARRDRSVSRRVRDPSHLSRRDVGNGQQLGLRQMLSNVTDPATGAAYSLGQQLAITIWNIAFAVVLVVWAFGWAGGRQLVERSYVDAQEKAAEQKAQRDRRRAASRTTSRQAGCC